MQPQVAVLHPQPVHLLEGIDDLQNDAERPVRRQRSFAAQGRLECLAGNVLHEEIGEVVVVDAHAVQRHDVGVAKLAEGSRLLEQPRVRVGIAARLGEELDYRGPVHTDLRAQQDQALLGLAEHRLKHDTTDGLPDQLGLG